ncbi:hypothetical protein ACH5RR_023111 [Cinchona calisaya]|uniref:Uncharacterized protein n=1 Tax=Cinchona calisaya TaxID=153742 RepID=A0ABD2Z9Q7_9GENT
MQLPTPEQGEIKGLSAWMAIDGRAKQTLYRLLWLTNDNESNLGIKRFLYDIQLSNTGVHLVPMFVSLCKRLNCTPAVVLNAIDTQEYDRQVKCLKHMLRLMASKESLHKRKLWKYGGIFDETFMADIQTKACPKLVCVFAEALRSEAPQTYSGVSQIAQLADVSESNKKWCAAVAQQMLRVIRMYPKGMEERVLSTLSKKKLYPNEQSKSF